MKKENKHETEWRVLSFMAGIAVMMVVGIFLSEPCEECLASIEICGDVFVDGIGMNVLCKDQCLHNYPELTETNCTGDYKCVVKSTEGICAERCITYCTPTCYYQKELEEKEKRQETYITNCVKYNETQVFCSGYEKHLLNETFVDGIDCPIVTEYVNCTGDYKCVEKTEEDICKEKCAPYEAFYGRCAPYLNDCSSDRRCFCLEEKEME